MEMSDHAVDFIQHLIKKELNETERKAFDQPYNVGWYRFLPIDIKDNLERAILDHADSLVKMRHVPSDEMREQADELVQKLHYDVPFGDMIQSVSPAYSDTLGLDIRRALSYAVFMPAVAVDVESDEQVTSASEPSMNVDSTPVSESSMDMDSTPISDSSVDMDSAHRITNPAFIPLDDDLLAYGELERERILRDLADLDASGTWMSTNSILASLEDAAAAGYGCDEIASHVVYTDFGLNMDAPIAAARGAGYVDESVFDENLAWLNSKPSEEDATAIARLSYLDAAVEHNTSAAIRFSDVIDLTSDYIQSHPDVRAVCEHVGESFASAGLYEESAWWNAYLHEGAPEMGDRVDSGAVSEARDRLLDNYNSMHKEAIRQLTYGYLTGVASILHGDGPVMMTMQGGSPFSATPEIEAKDVAIAREAVDEFDGYGL